MAQLRFHGVNPDDPNSGQEDAPTMTGPAPPVGGGDTAPQPLAPPVGGASQGSQSPSDRAGDNALPGSPLSQPRSITPPSPEAQMGGSPNATPKMPSAPAPVAAQPPQPFQPTPAPQPMDLVKSPSIFGNSGASSMFGSQGGQLGGGLGVTGSAEGTGQALPSDLLFYLTKLLQGNK